MSNRSIEVRPALYDEVFQIRDTIVGARVLAEMPLPEVEEPWAIQYTLDLIRDGLVFVAVVDRAVVGVAILAVQHWPWNRVAKFLENIHLWVEPKHRKGGTGLKLIALMKARAKELNMPLSLRISFPDGAAETKDRLLRMQGFTYLGGTFWLK
jgi:GNAT superfamily N-acetyltransferase